VLEHPPSFHHLKDALADNVGSVLVMDDLAKELDRAVGYFAVFRLEQA
jgi:hypothetical protein